ncbi:hypothetical protein GCM10011613_13130 [Cellvibrio zantedeschiae]|uniref:Uncharacterized protein n=1 Tax=Cellvibrio zantedeschiae TaxID=1237077 RepID=A0ABQ3AWI5_9GAMM|nr:hypothetical protein [Cellvibrio zantedeschiae]GGY70100.1 hypothetical protein GCM10011613_13130 [Cellvibrio zantedeschiae]
MSEITQNAIFAREVQRRVDDLIAWIVENSPDKEHQLSISNFRDVRQTLFGLATNGSNVLQHIEPEPEQGGAQYINDNPAPWP